MPVRTLPSPPSRSPERRQPAFIVADNSVTLKASDVREVLSQPVAGTLVADAAALLTRAGAGIMLAGALPFDREAASHLLLCERTERHHGMSAARLPAGRHGWQITERPTRDGYAAAVSRALESMAASAIDGPVVSKVVLARMLELEATSDIDPLEVFARLATDPNVTRFCVPLPAGPGGQARTLVGASPELLVDRHGRQVRSLPLAGSTPRRADAAADRDAAQALLHSAKDQREHRLVIEFVLDTLAPDCKHLHAPDTPVLTSTATMWHLATPVEGELRRDVPVLELAAALHPTPAVCGTPRDAASALIAELEPFDRGFFTGAVGWCDPHGDGRWMVTIRCAELAGASARLWAGAGIVPGSNPVAEADETGAKFRTLLDALGVDARSLPSGHSSGEPDRQPAK